MMPLLEAQGLNVVYEPSRGARVWSVRDVDLTLEQGEFVGLVGESGCGKSTLGYAITRMLRPPAKLSSGRILFDGQDVTTLDGEALRRYRHRGISLVLQSGMNALNPVRSVEDHFGDVLRAHGRTSGAEIRRRGAELLDKVHLPATTLSRYPHELSGGMRQRIAIAVALALDPRLVVFDEPTTALDVIVQDAVMRTIKELQQEAGFTALLISHDLGTVVDATDRLMVMYAGRIVEDRPSDTVLRQAAHPYTQALLRCYADPRADVVHLEGIPGSPPDLSLEQTACPFAPRCTRREEVCMHGVPALTDVGGALAACAVATRSAKEAGHAR
jgi:oligopeptide/dipeptide ABC transporter ATP-binding protein